jgi:Family of unknown function (DUF6325)
MTSEPALPAGPLQMLVLGFDDGEGFAGTIVPELERLRELEAVRLVDLLFVRKDEDGELHVDRAVQGSLAAALVGLGPAGEETSYAAVAGAALDGEAVWYLADAVPPGSTAAVALIEHRWAIPLRERIVEAGAVALADEWVHPADLLAVVTTSS